MPTLHHDFETASAADLRKVGVHKYAEDLSTKVWCMSYAIDDGPVQLWIPGKPCPPEYVACAKSDDWAAMAHNAAFEQVIARTVMTRLHNWPVIPLSRYRCSMAMAYAMSLPGSLDGAAGSLDLEDRKDTAGKANMLKMAKPRRIVIPGDKTYAEDRASALADPNLGTILADNTVVVWWGEAVRRERLYSYCLQDSVVEQALEKRLLPLIPAEQELWALDQEINNRGAYIDLKSIRKARQIVACEQERLDEEMRAVTQGAAAKCTSVAALTAWIAQQGVVLPGVAKGDIVDLLEQPDLPTPVREALLLRQEGAKSSLAKLKAMEEGACADSRVRGTLQYHGASTGRWTGRRIQTTNLPRPEMLKQQDIDEVFESLSSDVAPQTCADYIRTVYGAPLQALADSVRGFICAPPGHDLIAADLSAIEARGIAWLAGQEDVLRVFRRGDAHPELPDIYCTAASRMYGRQIGKKNKAERSGGKVLVLSMGYGGGVGALSKMAKTYRVDMAQLYDVLWDIADDDQRSYSESACRERLANFPKMSREFFIASDIAKQLWRVDNAITVGYWLKLETAATQAVLEPGTIFSAGAVGRQIKFVKSGSFLWVQLPSGRCLCYPYPEVKLVKTPWGKEKYELSYMGVDAINKTKWSREQTYGGKLAENMTQATCRDLLVESLKTLNAKGYYTPAHVYDEIVCEVPLGFGSIEKVVKIMCTPPQWAKDFPIAAEGWRGTRYRKG
jgi:DNA polymerase